MTDAVIEAFGGTLEEAFEYAARGLCDTMVDLKTVEHKMQFTIDCSGHDEYSLLFDWLDKVMLYLVADGIVLSDFKVRIYRNSVLKLSAVASGEKLDLAKHDYKVEIKAVTYHEMKIAREGPRVTLRFLLDL